MTYIVTIGALNSTHSPLCVLVGYLYWLPVYGEIKIYINAIKTELFCRTP